MALTFSTTYSMYLKLSNIVELRKLGYTNPSHTKWVFLSLKIFPKNGL